MKNLLIILILTALLVSLVSALTSEEIKLLQENLEGKELPKNLKGIFGNQKINLYLEQENGDDIILGIETNRNFLKKINEKAFENPTVQAYAKESKLRQIAESEDTISGIILALSKKEIHYNGVGFFNRVKFGFVKFFTRFYKG